MPGASLQLFSALFARGAVAAEITDAAVLQALLDVEAGLARALAHARMVPLSAAEAVTAAARAEKFDLADLAAASTGAGNPVPALVKALLARVPPEAAGAVHTGATSQDIVDSALMLIIKRSLPHLQEDLASAASACARLARQHGTTVMSGRTLLQQATPISFGLKAAGYLHALDQAGAHLQELSRSQLLVQLGGASGTLSVLETRGVELARLLASELGLAEPTLPWHTLRMPIMQWATGLGMTAAVLGKIARDITLLAQSEVDEVSEPEVPGRGISSTMPHKRNPVGAIVALSCTRRAPALVAGLLSAAEQEHERAAGAWHAEWESLLDLLRLTGSAAHWMREVLEGLQVNATHMRANLDAGHDFPLAERVSSALSPTLGKAAAQSSVRDAVLRAAKSGERLRDTLDPALLERAGIDEAALEALLDPNNDLGSAAAFIERALAEHEKLRQSR
ncbi:MAG TPA: adenylosuccinate lyase family protein [Polyangiales bacterium]|nr:adenylosuccinate lyase family protein [Polyangiales bacterium]